MKDTRIEFRSSLQKNEAIQLSNHDRDLFLQALDQPPDPAAKLKKAIARTRKTAKISHPCSSNWKACSRS